MVWAAPKDYVATVASWADLLDWFQNFWNVWIVYKPKQVKTEFLMNFTLSKWKSTFFFSFVYCSWSLDFVWITYSRIVRTRCSLLSLQLPISLHGHQEVTAARWRRTCGRFSQLLLTYLSPSAPLLHPLSLCISFRLNKTFPCHGILKVVYMCMSNAMNMDVTSFFGAWPPACPLAGTPPPPPKAQDTTSQWAQRA